MISQIHFFQKKRRFGEKRDRMLNGLYFLLCFTEMQKGFYHQNNWLFSFSHKLKLPDTLRNEESIWNWSSSLLQATEPTHLLDANMTLHGHNCLLACIWIIVLYENRLDCTWSNWKSHLASSSKNKHKILASLLRKNFRK